MLRADHVQLAAAPVHGLQQHGHAEDPPQHGGRVMRVHVTRGFVLDQNT